MADAYHLSAAVRAISIFQARSKPAFAASLTTGVYRLLN
jgi:hypothetical protein